MIVKKGKIAQFFCKHSITNWYSRKEPFFNLSGDTHYKICESCGKQVDKKFVRHD